MKALVWRTFSVFEIEINLKYTCINFCCFLNVFKKKVNRSKEMQSNTIISLKVIQLDLRNVYKISALNLKKPTGIV